jgi:hypothetical protein
MVAGFDSVDKVGREGDAACDRLSGTRQHVHCTSPASRAPVPEQQAATHRLATLSRRGPSMPSLPRVGKIALGHHHVHAVPTFRRLRRHFAETPLGCNSACPLPGAGGNPPFRPDAWCRPVTDPQRAAASISSWRWVEDGGVGIRGPVAYEFRCGSRGRAHPVRSVGREFDPAVLVHDSFRSYRQASSLTRMALAFFVQTKGLGVLSCWRM